MKTQYATWNELARFAGEYAHELKPQYAVYDSRGRFMARFLSHKRALAWVIASDMEWCAVIRKEKEDMRKHEIELEAMESNGTDGL